MFMRKNFLIIQFRIDEVFICQRAPDGVYRGVTPPLKENMTKLILNHNSFFQ